LYHFAELVIAAAPQTTGGSCGFIA